jgi:hypothetical protein
MLDHVSFAGAFRVLQGHEKTAGLGLLIPVVLTRPRVDVNDAIWRDDEMPGVSDAIGKYRRAEPWRQRQSRVIARAGRVRRIHCALVPWTRPAEAKSHQHSNASK